MSWGKGKFVLLLVWMILLLPLGLQPVIAILKTCLIIGLFCFYLYHLREKVPRTLVWILLGAFVLRLGLALSIDSLSVFPDYYFSDENRYHASAQGIASGIYSWDLHDVVVSGSPGHEAFEALLGAWYLMTGGGKVSGRLLCILLHLVLIAFIYGETCARINKKTAVFAAGLFAFWPSGVFFSTMIFRDPLIALGMLGGLWGFARVLLFREYGQFGAAILFTGVAYLFRPEALILVALCLAVFACGQLLCQRKVWALVQTVLCISCFVLVLWQWEVLCRRPGGAVSPLDTYASTSPNDPHVTNPPVSNSSTANLSPLDTYASTSPNDPHVTNPPAAEPQSRPTANLSPQGISRSRRRIIRASTLAPGGAQSSLFVDEEFHTWGDVLAFLPRGMFYVMYMPLPLLYPSDGRSSRLLSSFENLFLIAISFLLIAAIARRKVSSCFVPSGVFLFVTWAVHGLMDPDLGTAMRHKFYYLMIVGPVLGVALEQVGLAKLYPSSRAKPDLDSFGC